MLRIPVAILSLEDFKNAQLLLSDLSEYPGYEDWLDCRYGRLMGLSMAGVETNFVEIKFENFLLWCKRNGICPSERALDEFASNQKLEDENTVTVQNRPNQP